MNEFDRMPWLKPDATLQRPFSDDDLLEAVKKVLRTDNSNAGRKEPIDGYKHLFPRRIYYIICWTFITTILHTALN